jgi:hypothetical protein
MHLAAADHRKGLGSGAHESQIPIEYGGAGASSIDGVLIEEALPMQSG